MATREPIIGIDLGTTNSEVALLREGIPQVLKLHDEGVVPSCVALDAKGNVIVGREARNQILVNPRATVCSIKRKMGSNEKVRLGKELYRPQEVSAFILKALKRRAESLLGVPVAKAVITVPAYFTDAQRFATREAGEIAGLQVVRIINEPTAAALSYGAQKETNQRILVYDLGGGTFDVSIVVIEGGVVEVLSSTGNNHLGGDDFDARIVDRLLEVLEEEHHLKEKDLADPILLSRLKHAAENAKIELSENPFALIEEDHLGRVQGQPVHLSYELSRFEFETMIRQDIESTMESVSQALRDAALLPGAVDKVLLVGGSTRIPLVAELLEEKFRKMPHSEVDPDLCVALGASIQAAIEAGQEVGSVLVDVTPYTFGTAAIDAFRQDPFRYVPLIKRNSKLPLSRSEVFGTVVDNQEAVDIEVYQGEDPDVRNNILIGKFFFKGLSAVPAGNEIVLRFGLDLNGLLKIHALEKETGRDIHGVVENAMRSFDDAKLNESRNRVEALWGEEQTVAASTPPAAPESEAVPAGDPVRETLERARSMLSKALPEDQEDMVNLIEGIEDAMHTDDGQKAEELREELDDLLFYLE